MPAVMASATYSTVSHSCASPMTRAWTSSRLNATRCLEKPREAGSQRDLRDPALRIAEDAERRRTKPVPNIGRELAERRLGQRIEVLVLGTLESLPAKGARHACLHPVRMSVMPMVVHPEHHHVVLANERALESRHADVRLDPLEHLSGR